MVGLHMISGLAAWYQALPPRKKSAVRFFVLGILLLLLGIIGFVGALPYYQALW